MFPPTPEEDPRPGRLPFRVALLFALGTAGLAIFFLAGHGLLRSRAHHLAKAEVETRNLARALMEGMTASYDKIDLAVQAVKDEKERLLRTGRLDGPALDHFIERQHARIPVLFALRTTDASGIIDHGMSGVTQARASVADRDHFKRLKADPSNGLVISEPLQGRFSGQTVIIFARRINGPDGSFAGIAYGTLHLEQIVKHFTSLTIGREGIISLRHADPSVIIAGHGPRGNIVGRTERSEYFWKPLVGSQTSGTFTAPGAIDGTIRIHSFDKLSPYNHTITVGIGVGDALAPWRRECLQTSVIAVSFLCLIAIAAHLVNRAWRLQLKAEEQRRQTTRNLQAALEEVKALSGLLPICAYCKKIRDDHGYWSQIEAYISSHSEAHFTHSICPECVSRHFPEVNPPPQPPGK